MLIPVAFQQNHRDEVRLVNGDGAIAGALAAEAGMKQQNYVGVPVAFQPRIGRNGRGYSEGVVPALGGAAAGATSDMRPCVAFTTEQTPKFNVDCALTLTKQSPTGGGQPQAVAMINMQGSKGNAVSQADGPSYSLNAMHGHDVHAIAVPTEQAYKVRRLTPTECLRLQNFPDNWFDGLDFSDSVKYRCLGNAVCVAVSEWIASRIWRLG